ncbi:MAG: ATP-grasp domain-containing protein [Bifidobacterium sp.]|uniref:ATP-grasp domain-containing protein n=1 Tax=Bifidobacterium sp. TaxID=41200 RepID=UPI0039E9D389
MSKKLNVWALISGFDDVFTTYQDMFPQELRDKATTIYPEQVTVGIGDGKNIQLFYQGKPMERPDVFWPMISNTETASLEKLLVRAGIPSIVNMREVEVARSKVDTYQLLKTNGIPVPDSFVFFDKPDKSAIEQHFGYPFVVKPNYGFGGEGVTLIESEEEFDAFIAQAAYGQTYIAQEYIATSRGRDVRVVLLNGEYLYSTMRKASDPQEFRSNVHVGGELLKYPIDQETQALCARVASLFDLPLIGLDLMFGTEGFVLAEVNAFPGMYPAYMLQALNAAIEGFEASRSPGIYDDLQSSLTDMSALDSDFFENDSHQLD